MLEPALEAVLSPVQCQTLSAVSRGLLSDLKHASPTLPTLLAECVTGGAVAAAGGGDDDDDGGDAAVAAAAAAAAGAGCQLLLTGHSDGYLVLWDASPMAELSMLALLATSEAPLTAVAMCATARQFLAASAAGELVLYGFQTGDAVADEGIAQRLRMTVDCVAVAAVLQSAADAAALLDEDGGVSVVNLRTGDCTRVSFAGAAAGTRATSLALSAAPQKGSGCVMALLLVGRSDGAVALVDMSSAHTLALFDAQLASPVTHLFGCLPSGRDLKPAGRHWRTGEAVQPAGLPAAGDKVEAEAYHALLVMRRAMVTMAVKVPSDKRLAKQRKRGKAIVKPGAVLATAELPGGCSAVQLLRLQVRDGEVHHAVAAVGNSWLRVFSLPLMEPLIAAPMLLLQRPLHMLRAAMSHDGYVLAFLAGGDSLRFTLSAETPIRRAALAADDGAASSSASSSSLSLSLSPAAAAASGLDALFEEEAKCAKEDERGEEEEEPDADGEHVHARGRSSSEFVNPLLALG
eukprot:PLAT6436.2.p1 GENE.PLAT6436.2~~PLAT6436.2.p1  ORF type:complete len:548 (-),score=272.28 PLAT6436.2:60-1613(-)